MTKKEFLLNYLLNHRTDSLHQYCHACSVKQAAVLIPLIDDGKQLHILFTKRALHLRHHAGQISFPGGKVEHNDKNLIDTATRETFEEIGVSPKLVEIIGSLHSYHVSSGFVVKTYIAFIPPNLTYIKDSNEVSEIFQVPLHFFLDSLNHISINVLRENRTQQVHYMPYKHYKIWGATALMIKDLVSHLS